MSHRYPAALVKSIAAGALVMIASLLAGCINSSAPILTEAKPLLGERLHLQLYSLRAGSAVDPEQVTYVWNGTHYARTRGSRNMNDFTVHAFEGGDLIVQTVPSGRVRSTEYALLHPLMDGVYYVVVIDEDDADEATRNANCAKAGDYACRVTTREQLFAFARATAARKKTDGGLAIRLADEKAPQKRRR